MSTDSVAARVSISDASAGGSVLTTKNKKLTNTDFNPFSGLLRAPECESENQHAEPLNFYDGILHDDAVYWSRSEGIHIRTPGMRLFEWSFIFEELLAP